MKKNSVRSVNACGHSDGLDVAESYVLYAGHNNSSENLEISHKTHLAITRTVGTVQGIHKRMVRFQKLTRNLFLNLHGHNVHRQQRQLSKFRARFRKDAPCMVRLF